MIKAILFDLDNTLLPMDEDKFTKGYFAILCKKLEPFGYNSETLVNTIWAGTNAMIKNDGTITNEEAFWRVFEKQYGERSLKDKKVFDEFYQVDFSNTKMFCGENECAKQVVDMAKARGFKTILSSNPIFPKLAMVTRAGFVGLGEQDFDYITSYENSHYSKPNPKYFEEILKINNLKPDEVILFGNSQEEDIQPATSIGIKSYLVSGETNKTLPYKTMLNVINKINS